jgi:hypothetical protein
MVIMDKLICLDCKDECQIVEETFDYSGTHCTNGNGGVHHTGHYSSDCCNAEYMDADEYHEEQDEEEEDV